MDAAARIDRLVAEVSQVIDGKTALIREAVTVMIAGGHLLIEDVPGVGKTQLARALAKAIGGTMHRVQFTPDLLPSDITGVNLWVAHEERFRFVQGPVFANIVLADEINRASPKTQAAMLESMAEHQVTVDGESFALPDPFVVVATQNPLDMEGTYALPEAQRDRFMAKFQIGYPDREAELRMVQSRETREPLDSISQVESIEGFRQLQQLAQHVRVHPVIEQYAVDLVRATRSHPQVALGASPRSTLQLVSAAKAAALAAGRDFALPDDVQAQAATVLPHRLILERAATADADTIVRDLVRETPAPRTR